MSRSFLSSSFNVTNVDPTKRAEASAWLISHDVSYQFCSHKDAFEYVKFDKASADEFQQTFPSAKVVKSTLQVAVNW